MKQILHSSTAIVFMALGVVLVTAPGQAEARQWNMCNWEEIPVTVLRRIERRTDFEDILDRMFRACPEQALALTDRPVGTVQDDVERVNEPDDRNFGGGGSSSGGSGGSSGGGGGSTSSNDNGPPGDNDGGPGPGGPGGGLGLG